MSSFFSVINPWSAEKMRSVSEYFTLLHPDVRLRIGVATVYANVARKHHKLRFDGQNLKNSKLSLKYKNKSVKKYTRGKKDEALKNIILSISTCPDTYKLAIAIGSRSLLLHLIGDYISAIVDANRIFELYKGPPNLIQLLREEKRESITLLNKQLRDDEHYTRKKYLNITDPDEFNDAMFLSRLFYKKMEFRTHETKFNVDNWLKIPEVFYKNALLPNATSKINISKDEIKKRFIKAVDNIETGEILIVEKPLVSALDPDRMLTHCSFCFVRCTSLMPCKLCTVALYCSQKCYDKALKKYHTTECRIFQFTEKKKLTVVGTKLVALRLFLICTDNGRLLRDLMNHEVYGNPCSNKDFNFDQPFHPKDYFNIHNMEDNYEFLTVKQWHTYCEEAAFLLFCLKKISFFSSFQSEREQQSKKLSELEEFAGSLLLKFWLCSIVNCHGVSEFVHLPNKLVEVQLGVAIYPTLRFASHSCNQNISRFFHKNYIVVRSCRPIAAGEEVFDNYGQSYLTKTLEERQEHLQRNYFFECKCAACEENWPLVVDLPSDFSKAECKIPKEQINMKQVEEWSKKYHKISPACSDEALYFFYTYITFLHKTFRQPFKEHALVEISMVFSEGMRGNYYNHKKEILLDVKDYVLK